MSDLIVALQKIIEVKEHPNADRLDVAVVLGWEVATQKGNVQSGDIVLYVPPDALIPRSLAEQWGVAPYLSFKSGSNMGRVRAARIRSYVSYGFTVPAHKLGIEAEIGEDLKEHFGIEKYEPPERLDAGLQEKDNPLFHQYTDIQRIENYPEDLIVGEEVVATEKIHGTNSRVGLVSDLNSETEEHEFVLMIGSHKHRRKFEEGSLYYVPIRLLGEAKLKAALQKVLTDRGILKGSAILFGEVYGAGVQKGYPYETTREASFRVFDLAVNGVYVNHDVLLDFCQENDIQVVPELFRGSYDYGAMKQLSQGNSTLGKHIREGIVVKPVVERYARIGAVYRRTIYKFINPEYELKDNPDSH